MSKRLRSCSVLRLPFAVPGKLAVSVCDDIVDEMLLAYVCWHEECETVREAYARFSPGDGFDRTQAFWAYLAALKREERAAAVYASYAELVVDLLNSTETPAEFH
jgi:hypothetical protein